MCVCVHGHTDMRAAATVMEVGQGRREKQEAMNMTGAEGKKKKKNTPDLKVSWLQSSSLLLLLLFFFFFFLSQCNVCVPVCTFRAQMLWKCQAWAL